MLTMIFKTWIGYECGATALINTWTEQLLVDVTVCVPAGVSLSSSVQRCTSSANMPRPRAVLCSCKAERTSPSSPDKQRQEFETVKNTDWINSSCSPAMKLYYFAKKTLIKPLKQYFLFNADNKGVCLYMCSFTSAVVIVYGEHVDGDDLQHVCAAQ